MVKCAVKNCTSRSDKVNKTSGVTFHRVPKEPKRMMEWIKNIRLLRKETDWLPSPFSAICSKHFRDEQLRPPKKDSGNYRLSADAVPIVVDTTKSASENEDLGVATDDEMLEIFETSREHKMRETIKRLKFVSSRRLKCIKTLRQQIKRLNMKNEKLQMKNEQLFEVIEGLKGNIRRKHQE